MIYLGADHGGYQLKEKVKQWLDEWGYPYKDLGAHTLDPEDDYPQFAAAVAQKVSKEDDRDLAWKKRAKGILLCRSAGGVIIVANKFSAVRAVAAYDTTGAKHSREHNDANILGISGDWTNDSDAKKMIKIWLETEFSKEARHDRRIKQILKLENQCCCDCEGDCHCSCPPSGGCCC